MKKHAAERPTSLPDMTIKDTAGCLNVHPDSVRGMIARGELPAFRVGRVIRIRREDINAALERQRIGA
ncbi:MAG: helix-turn-helix domain-containing protein [Mycobacterium sp.]|uniref:helix-turn-helix domain-containing protein n=1 Tax=Mycobacterium sp. TaxID=1785 RepID=UPI003F95D73A